MGRTRLFRQIMVSADTWAALKAQAEAENVSMSALIADMLAERQTSYATDQMTEAEWAREMARLH